MNDSIFNRLHESVSSLKMKIDTSELAAFADEQSFTPEQLDAICATFDYLKERKHDMMVSTMLRLSKLPLKAPKTFENFDFDYLHGKHVDDLKNLTSLSALYAHKNLAFIGPQGVGKTHLAMAFGRKCCLSGYKTYFLKASELNQKFTDARKRGKEGSTVNGLVKPSCLIIDEIGRCVFDKENTRLFFDVIDRRYNKEGPNTMIMTSNKTPDQWKEYFNEDDTLLCTLDRIFDNANVYLIRGDSYRGRKLSTYGVNAGVPKSTEIKSI